MRKRTMLRGGMIAGSAALASLVFSLGMPFTAAPSARADYAPAPGDLVGVGSGLVQSALDFGDDGDTDGDSGYNDAGNLLKVVSFDATADANGRVSYLNGSTLASPLLLNPTVVLRGGTYPLQRPASGPAAINALLADTSPADPAINFALTSSLPTAAQISQAVANGWGGLEVFQLGDADLAMTAAQAATNAPPGLSAQQLVQIYTCTPAGGTQTAAGVTWAQLGATGPNSGDHIIPELPPPGSDTSTTFLADLTGASDGTAVTPGPCVITVGENDPTAITSLTGTANPNGGTCTPACSADAIEPLDDSILNLWNGLSGNTTFGSNPGTGYFHNPAANYPGGATLTAGAVQLTGTPSDGNPPYGDTHGLYVVYRSSDQASAIPWQPDSILNWPQTLFCNPDGTSTPFFQTAAGRTLTAEAGVNPNQYCANAAKDLLISGTDEVTVPNPAKGTAGPWKPTNGMPDYTWSLINCPASTIDNDALLANQHGTVVYIDLAQVPIKKLPFTCTLLGMDGTPGTSGGPLSGSVKISFTLAKN
jgi:hypothetical protein